MIQRHSICSTVGRHAALTTTHSNVDDEIQLWMSAARGQKRDRVLDLDYEAHYMIAGPSQPSSSTAPTPLPPQLESNGLRDRVQMIQRYIISCDPD
ncbi:UNVERIFIED_CONTAM: hypothetical protein Sradi_4910900 [Sesamum radiatum]|uniref:Uncharacterized protein n=1 Tax=Sesamum radiatum TaxID=300843 RepID=A0AAW2MD59_SESRA